jgi:hypothetical protein
MSRRTSRNDVLTQLAYIHQRTAIIIPCEVADFSTALGITDAQLNNMQSTHQGGDLIGTDFRDISMKTADIEKILGSELADFSETLMRRNAASTFST